MKLTNNQKFVKITNQVQNLEERFLDFETGSSSPSLVSNLERELWLYDEVSPTSVFDTIQAIREINKEDDRRDKELSNELDVSVSLPRKPIKLFINTPGGSVLDGFTLISIIKTSKTPVYTYGIGLVQSMGIPLLASGHKRFVYSNTRLMLHSVATFQEGTLETLRVSVKETEDIQKTLDLFIVNNSKITEEQLQKISTQNTDYYFDSTKALELGIVDEVITYV